MTAIRAATARARREQDGLTLIELLIGLALGLVVSLAAFGLVDSSLHLYSQITDRLDSAQTGQVALSNIEQTLESSCAVQLPPVEAASSSQGIPVGSDATHLVVLSAPGDADTASSQLTLHVIALSSTTNGTLTDTSYPYNTTAPAAPTQSTLKFVNTPTVRTLAAGVSQVSGVPVFQYFPLSAGRLSTTPDSDNPLTAADASNAQAVQIEFSVAPSSGSTKTTRQAVEEDLYAFRLSSVSNSASPTPCT